MVNLKALHEQREEQQAIMDRLLNTCGAENRAMTPEEIAAFDHAEAEIRAIDETITREERASQVPTVIVGGRGAVEEAEERAFTAYIMGTLENRAGEKNLSTGENGAIIPVTIVNRIITAVKDRCPILKGATGYNVKGSLKIPVWGDNAGHNIAVGYQTEFTAITADAGKFTSVDLGGFLAGALTLLGKSLENNATLNVTDFIIGQMAEAIAIWMEGELLNGTENKVQGALSTTNGITAAGAAAITADELITLQSKVKQAFQKNACWTMHPDTFTYIKKLKDGNQRYLLQDDVSGEFPFRLLGKPVYLSDNMPTMAAGQKSVLYGDYSGLSVNFRENINIQVLREKYADMHAIGVISWFELDAKVSNHQKLAALTQKAG